MRPSTIITQKSKSLWSSFLLSSGTKKLSNGQRPLFRSFSTTKCSIISYLNVNPYQFHKMFLFMSLSLAGTTLYICSSTNQHPHPHPHTPSAFRLFQITHMEGNSTETENDSHNNNNNNNNDDDNEEEEEQCPFCRYFLNSPCREPFKVWQKCVQVSK